jgi:hypothetical protein
VYNQLLYVPVRAYKFSFSTNRVGPGQLLKAGVSGCSSAMVHATGHTRERWVQFGKTANLRDVRQRTKMIFLKEVLEIRRGVTGSQAWRSEAVDLRACKNYESLFSVGLESFRISFDYKVKLVSKLRKIFDNFKYFEIKFEDHLRTAFRQVRHGILIKDQRPLAHKSLFICNGLISDILYSNTENLNKASLSKLFLFDENQEFNIKQHPTAYRSNSLGRTTWINGMVCLH